MQREENRFSVRSPFNALQSVDQPLILRLLCPHRVVQLPSIDIVRIKGNDIADRRLEQPIGVGLNHRQPVAGVGLIIGTFLSLRGAEILQEMKNPPFLLFNRCLAVVISRYRENLATVVRKLDVKLRVVHRRLVFAVRISLILVLVNEVAQMEKKRGSNGGLAPGIHPRIINLCGHRFRYH